MNPLDVGAHGIGELNIQPQQANLLGDGIDHLIVGGG